MNINFGVWKSESHKKSTFGGSKKEGNNFICILTDMKHIALQAENNEQTSR